MRLRTPAAVAVLVCAGLVSAAATSPATASTAQPPGIVIADGVTQPVHGYTDAVRERVWVKAGIDSDRDGVEDLIRVDIMRPAATEEGLKAPVIIDNSPYYTTLGRGNESEFKADVDGDGLNDRWPLYYDNYFVPRGYAVALVDMTGTAGSTGCPTIQGESENMSGPAVVDWLNGRNTAVDADGEPVVVDWHNGKSGMIGKSYDGALAMGAAVSGVEGLATVVPIGGPYNYYDYTRTNGLVQRGNNYLRSLATTITNDDRERQARCAPVWDEIDAADGDENGDYSPFWYERNYLDKVDEVTASVFLVHGLQEENVRADHASKMWAALGEHDVERKMWLSRTGHIEPFDFRRGEWVDTLHRWFDHYLLDIDNGIDAEPMVDVEVEGGVWEQHANWPIDGTEHVEVYLRDGAGGAGSFALTPAPGEATVASFVDNPSQTEAQAMNNPETTSASRLAFLSDPLAEDLRISGTPVVELTAASSQDVAYVGAMLVEYGPTEQNDRAGDGIRQNTTAPETCHGEASEHDDACYRIVDYRPITTNQWRVTKGAMDARNRFSLEQAAPLVPGVAESLSFPMLPEDYTFSEGNRIGVILVGSYRSYSVETLPSRPEITVDMTLSRISLPVVGGTQAASDAGIEALAGDVTATTRTLGGTPYVSVTAANDAEVPVDITVETDFGTKTFSSVAPGKSVAVSFNTRSASVGAGTATVTVTGLVDGETITVTKTASYPAR
ncbi:CocE/NonD family hydrolase [Microbacterium sp. NPDC055357]